MPIIYKNNPGGLNSTITASAKDLKNIDSKGEGGANPIANVVATNVNSASLDNGNHYVGSKILEKMPFGQNEIIKIQQDFNDENWENSKKPNMFAAWSDVVEAFSGTYFLEEAPDEILDHESVILLQFFLYSKVALYRVSDDKWLVGNYSTETNDHQGNVLKGKFIAWNYGSYENDENGKTINIGPNNNHNFINATLDVYGIPTFLKIGFYIQIRNLLYMFKKSNLGFSILKKIIFADSGAIELLTEFLKRVFNQSSDNLIVPIQVMDASIKGDGKGLITNLTVADMAGENQIDLKFDYLGNEINYDIDRMTQEIFRIAGLRMDTTAKAGNFQEKSNKGQTQQALTYFDARENYVLKFLNKFSRQFKKKFGLEMKWSTIYKKGIVEQAILDKFAKLEVKQNETPDV